MSKGKWQVHQKVSKDSVNYRIGSVSEHCGNCGMFYKAGLGPSRGRCDLVQGVIDKAATCDRWVTK